MGYKYRLGPVPLIFKQRAESQTEMLYLTKQGLFDIVFDAWLDYIAVVLTVSQRLKAVKAKQVSLAKMVLSCHSSLNTFCMSGRVILLFCLFYIHHELGFVIPCAESLSQYCCLWMRFLSSPLPFSRIANWKDAILSCTYLHPAFNGHFMPYLVCIDFFPQGHNPSLGLDLHKSLGRPSCVTNIWNSVCAPTVEEKGQQTKVPWPLCANGQAWQLSGKLNLSCWWWGGWGEDGEEVDPNPCPQPSWHQSRPLRVVSAISPHVFVSTSVLYLWND